MTGQETEKLELIASRPFKSYDDMYKIVDYLNKTLKHKKVMFGLNKNQDGSMTINVYET